MFVWDALVSNLDRLFGCEHPSSLFKLFAVHQVIHKAEVIG